MTERIYYTDPYCRSFEAVVTQAFEVEGRPAVALDRTAFYPTSGGQPFDTGRLGGVQVIDVVDQGDVIAHVLSSPVEVGTPVTGEIDWSRRFDHMQQHTGQHILSAALHRLFDNRTVSVHFGSDVATIDLQREPSVADIERAVDEANRVVWEDTPVAIRFAAEAERATLALRKESMREGTLRLIEVEGFDLSACGGTHVARTGAIGVIAVLSAERFKGGSRLTFVCGQRAVTALRSYRDAVAGSIRALSVLPAELPAAVERLQGEAKDLRRTLKGMQAALAGHEASRLLGEAETVGGVRTVVRVLDGWDATGLKTIASGVTAAGKAVVALVSATSPCLVVIARSPDAPGDAGAVVRSLIEQCGGRGGGKPDLAQAGGLNGLPADVAAAALSMLRS